MKRAKFSEEQIVYATFKPKLAFFVNDRELTAPVPPTRRRKEPVEASRGESLPQQTHVVAYYFLANVDQLGIKRATTVGRPERGFPLRDHERRLCNWEWFAKAMLGVST